MRQIILKLQRVKLMATIAVLIELLSIETSSSFNGLQRSFKVTIITHYSIDHIQFHLQFVHDNRESFDIFTAIVV